MKPSTPPKEESKSPLATATASPSYLNVKALTWLRDSHGLFDYESFQLTKNTLKIESSCIIGRCGTEVKILSKAEIAQSEIPQTSERIDKLGWVVLFLGKYFIESCSSKYIYDSQLDKLWLIIRAPQQQSPKRVPQETYNKQEILLRKGDVLRLGRMAFRVKDYRVEGAPEAVDSSGDLYQDNHIDLQPTKCLPIDGNSEVCKFCFSGQHSPDNPLLSICNCSGSLRFVHHKCLQAWLATKLSLKNSGNVTTYYLKLLECEICKFNYPCNAQVLNILDSVSLNERKYSLVEFKKPDKGSFIQLETFCKDKNFSRVVYIAQTDAAKPQFKLGRGHDSELKIGDISVSRVHALIMMTPKGYVLQDNAAKFGTLLLLSSGQHEINPASGLSIQVSRTTLTLTIKPLEKVSKLASGALVPLSNEGTHASHGSNSEGDNNSENVSGDEIQKNVLPDAGSKKTPAKPNQ